MVPDMELRSSQREDYTLSPLEVGSNIQIEQRKNFFR